jgi:ribosomal-protein-alanine N-acetyltransferase
MASGSIEVRPGQADDLQAVAVIQQQSPQAAQWDPAAYLEYDFLVAVASGRVAGFLVGRRTAPGESELLNLAVLPELRRKGVARALWDYWISGISGAIFLEVRESNHGARTFYKVLGFQEVGSRSQYYSTCPEHAIVMKFHSC